jgi:adenine/guanine phosphoribosyltransferase-like PRPP-binding protein
LIRVNIVEFDQAPEPLIFDIAAAGEAPPPDGAEAQIAETILYVTVPRWATPQQIDRHINLIGDEWQVSADLVVLRIHPPDFDAVRRSTAAEDIASRYPDASVVALTWSGGFRFEHLGGGDLDDADEMCARVMPALRDAELRALVQRAGVVLPADDSFHYEGPNGLHYESFVRVGTAIQAVDSLDGIAFWLLDYLAKSPVILLDSWTILSLGLNCDRYLRELGGGGYAHTDGPAPPEVVAVECQRYYNEPDLQVQQRLDSHRRKFPPNGPVPPALAIVSVSSTGTTADRLRAACDQAGFNQVEVVCLFTPTGPESGGMCALPEIAAYWERNGCPKCEAGSQTVRVLPSSYLLDLAATVRDDVAIRLPNAAAAADFFGRYSGAGVVTVHRDQLDGSGRHHMVYVDVERLLAHPRFEERVDRELDDVGTVDAVLGPENGPGARLAAYASERLNVPSVLAEPHHLPELAASEREVLAQRRLLVVEDVVMTGTRLRLYRNWLHRIGVATAENFELQFLAGVARPTNLTALRGVADFTHGLERFHFAELFMLPNWGRRECPWCKELELLKRHSADVDENVAAFVRNRYEHLSRADRGLDRSLFISWQADGGPLQDPWLLGPGSIFRAQSEPELFAAVASSLQDLRNAGFLNEQLTLPVARVLDRHFTFDGRYYDTVISACILRAARRHDLRAVTADAELERMVRERLREDARLALHGELLFALHRQQLPGGGALAEVEAALADDSADQGVRQLFKAALEA